MNLSRDRFTLRSREGTPSPTRPAQNSPMHWHTSYRAANLRPRQLPSFLTTNPPENDQLSPAVLATTPPSTLLELTERRLDAHPESFLIPARLQPLVAVPPSATSSTVQFERLFHAFAQRWNLPTCLRSTTWTQAGLLLGVDTYQHLAQLWEKRDEWEQSTGWELLPRPPPKIWLQLDNVPCNIGRELLLQELFNPRHVVFSQLRDLQHEVNKVVTVGRVSYLKGPPEFLEAARLEPEVTIGVRLVTFRDYLPLRLCRQCSSFSHTTAQCVAPEFCCGYCSGADHPTGRCPLWRKPHRYQCATCILASRPVHLIGHSVMDQWQCPSTKDYFARHRAQIETRPLPYRELRKYWLLYNRFQDAHGKPLFPRPGPDEVS